MSHPTVPTSEIGMRLRRSLAAHVAAVRRNKAVVSVLLVGLLMLGGVLFGFEALWVRNHSVASSIREDALWATYQTDRETTKLAETLHAALDGLPTATPQELGLRFDILYSRHEVMEEADFPAKFRNDRRLEALTGDVGRILHRMVPVFDRIAAEGRVDRAVLTGLSEEASLLKVATERLLISTHHLQSELQADDRVETSRIYALLGGAITAMTLAMGAVITMIWRQLRQIEIARFRLQRLTEELAQSAAAAEAGARAKSAFLATMSHEIRTPLNGIIGMAELLAATPLDAGQRDRLGTIRQCSDGLVALIDDILDFSKLESGKIDLERRPMDLGEVVDGVVDMFAPKADTKGIELVASHPSGHWITDPTRFRQILVNLVGNAVKFTDQGAVAIRVFSTHHGDGPAGLRVVVEDTGIGISPENIKRLFREFTQADASINRRFGGTGLGLAITRRIVRALGGDIHVESREGRGTTFWFEIPADRVVEPEPAPVAPGLDVRVEAAAPLVASVVERGLVLLGHGVHRSARGEERRAVVIYDVAAFAQAAMAGRIDPAAAVVVFGHGAGAFAGEAREVVEGPMTSRRLARLLAHLEAGSRYGGVASPFAGDAAIARSIGQGRVLLVEDNAVNQRVAEGLLTRLGFGVDVVGDGAQAVARVAGAHYDAVLMDMQMPDSR
jgi:signal transduction histidine kinase